MSAGGGRFRGGGTSLRDRQKMIEGGLGWEKIHTGGSGRRGENKREGL